MIERKIKKRLLKLPHSPGVYLFLDGRKRIIYVGKAADLKSRVQSYFCPFGTSPAGRRKPGSQSPLKSGLAEKTAKIKWQKTDSEIEALILEANLIKKHQPDFNVLLKDSSDYFYVGITKETFPKVFITHQVAKYQMPRRSSDVAVGTLRGRQNTKYVPSGHLPKGDQIPEFIGPFTDGTALKNALKIVRKVFPFCTCRQLHKRPCLNAEIGRCPGVCCLLPKLAAKQPGFKEDLRQYRQNVAAFKKIIAGKKRKLASDLNREMKKTAAEENFEKAAVLRDQIKNLQKIFSHKKVLFPRRATVSWPETSKIIQKLLQVRRNFERIEAYDISHISGEYSVGAMVVFKKGEASPGDYRRFKIKSAARQDDPAMIREIIRRRIYHADWPLPDLILVDGGKPQLNAAVNAKICPYGTSPEGRQNLPLRGISRRETKSKKIKVIALAKDKNNLYLEKRKKPVTLDSLPQELQMLILRIRDQAHRFAIKYHRKLRSKIY